MRRLLLTFVLAISVAGCAGQMPQIGGVAPVANPLNAVNMYRVELGYATALQLAADWREFCWKRSYSVLMTDPIGKVACVNRRATLRAIKSARRSAGTAVVAAREWSAANPTLTTGSYIDAAWVAVTSFQSATPKVK